ncbi:hypothetical protein [Foetidibacter luteolus]|uniref:hypothetical protein n=1 Tax=Foetidibacter luteolus TaxID=2608880 RepID=UPI00129A7FD6|nr:hypothetical protein [Foetidibacter luteolus]
MGLDYRYITIIEKSNRERLITKLSIDATEHKSKFGNCTVIHFKLDKDILHYLKREIQQNERLGYWKNLFFRKSRFNDYFLGDKVKIGCIYIEEENLSDFDYLIVSFKAASTSMSILFQNSRSIKEWFVDLSKEVNAAVTFLDMEDDGYRIIYKNGMEMEMTFPEDAEKILDEQKFYLKIFEDFGRARNV